ncbi:hypothetical protein niasHT_036073 [Heterodera trifolii]|uniref:Uncharacterized protein n=1 Tax=Heterodera trifolii TaxID=157864 RepID=A0ABD2IHY3_9BILA
MKIYEKKIDHKVSAKHWQMAFIQSDQISKGFFPCNENAFFCIRQLLSATALKSESLVAESASVTKKNFFSLSANSDETISFSVKFGDDWFWMIVDEKIGGKLRTSDLDDGTNTKFKLIPQTSGNFVIKASNGKFVSCRSENHWLVADMESPKSLYEEFVLDMVTKITDTVTARVPLKIQ